MKNQNLFFLNTINQLAECSTCSKSKVGAIIVKDKRIISCGYNGSLPKTPHCEDVGCLLDSNGKCVRTIHAETNALMFCVKNGISVKDCDIYCTRFPCDNCIKLLYMAGIKKIFYCGEIKKEYKFSKIIKSEKITY
jgi:dCMP deaminase